LETPLAAASLTRAPGTRPAGLVLAAGAGRRMGGPKALLPYAGRPLLERAVAVLREGGCAPVYTVLGAGYGQVRPVADAAGATVVHNTAWRKGMGSSLRAGLTALAGNSQVSAVVIVLVDQPWIGAGAVRRLLDVHAAGAIAAMARYDAVPGHPVLLARALWQDVAAMASGEVGARAYLHAHPELVVLVDCNGTGRPDDLDTPADLDFPALLDSSGRESGPEPTAQAEGDPAGW
jgi:CTP:molybdopterin cytidylyltransferase MocA